LIEQEIREDLAARSKRKKGVVMMTAMSATLSQVHERAGENNNKGVVPIIRASHRILGRCNYSAERRASMIRGCPFLSGCLQKKKKKFRLVLTARSNQRDSLPATPETISKRICCSS
jgi:hypothetical protein